MSEISASWLYKWSRCLRAKIITYLRPLLILPRQRHILGDILQRSDSRLHSANDASQKTVARADKDRGVTIENMIVRHKYSLSRGFPFYFLFSPSAANVCKLEARVTSDLIAEIAFYYRTN